MSYKIVVALDFSKLGEKVADFGYTLANTYNAEVTFLHVVPEPNVIFNSYAPSIPLILDANMEELLRVAKRKLDLYIHNAGERHGKAKCECKQAVEIGDASQCIIEYAKKHRTDMIVLGYRGHSTIDELLVGSTANKVTRYAPCSVLIYRPDKA